MLPAVPPRFPTIARACLCLNALFLIFWVVYLLGPDVFGLILQEQTAPGYRLFGGAFFALHFILISTGIIALFVVIIEIYAARPFRGFRAVLLALALPIASFLYFASRFLLQVRQWGESQGWMDR